ncbi:MAG TPA: glycosyltransferase family A protein [Chthoniobacteraceae bacterium]|jgi:GT2 family glycosyltransferase|nr:glycosyltransferase family A protein [Chthoniobacteraceae bacterium]
MPALVSIGIPCYNAERWIAGAVRSALDQTWPEKEVIVADDGSTDGTLGVLEQFGGSVRIERASHGGANRARNLLLRAARGEWIQYVDADDYLRPEKIERQFAEAAPAERADIIYSPVLREQWKDGQPLTPEPEPLDSTTDIYTQLLRWQLPQTSGALWRKRALEQAGGWDEDPSQLCDEHDCYYRALKAGCRFVFAPTPNAVYRIWSAETRSHSNQRPVIFSRTALSEGLRDWLKARGEWTAVHDAALGQAFLEMARKLAGEDIHFAAKYHAARKRDIRLSGPAAPQSYQFAYRALGFRAAEWIAHFVR